MSQRKASRPERPDASDRTARAPEAPACEPPSEIRLPASVAHELANPLVAMTQAVSVLRGSLEDPDDVELADCVLTEGRRLRRLIQRSAAAGWRPVRAVDATAIEELIHAVVALVRLDPRAPADVRFHLRLEPGLEPIPMDRDAVTQVLWNLVLNAVQAVDREGNVTVLAERATGGGLRVEVRDDGPGVPAGDVEGLFATGVSLRAEGTGHGLAVSREIVEAHGGALTFEPSESGGARVRFLLPRNGPPSHAGTSETQTDPTGSRPTN